MSWLRSALTPLPLDLAIRGLADRSLPAGAVAVTFDDGDPTIMENALPVLRSLQIPATAFVCPGLIDTNEPFWWQVVDLAREHGVAAADGRRWTTRLLKEVEDTERRWIVNELRAELEARLGSPVEVSQLSTPHLRTWLDSGNLVGNHTWDHPILDLCDQEQQRRQVLSAHEWLSERFGECRVFAYPNGNMSEVTRAVLQELGYQAALLFDHKLAGPADYLALSRIRVNGSDPLSEFQAKATGVHPRFMALRQAARKGGR
jgi:peptidoglycan/xylan/chitin deacetylase (PgdA/CDA1 family)